MEDNYFDSEIIEVCRNRLNILGTDDFIDYEIAYHFIQHSAWWRHPKSGWVRAPKHAERLEYGNYGLEVSFGANRFLVELAIKRSIKSCADFLQFCEWELSPSISDLRNNLRLNVLSAVANYQGTEFPSGYPESDGMMIFGVQAIRVVDFVDIVDATVCLSKNFS